MTDDSFDYIIVGAGSSGCVLANRLSADPNIKVCLIEAGKKDRNLFIKIPLGVARLFFHPVLNWRYKTVPQTHAGNREIYVPRGKVLGGSSAINGMIYTRGHPTDYDDWAKLGNKGWSFRDVLPYFLRSEHNPDFPDSPYHGQGGELHVQFLDMYNPLCQTLFDAAEKMQYQTIDDFCGPTHEGFSRRQVNIKNGTRQSTAEAFLKPIRNRKNLTVLTQALTRKVVLEDGRAVGVEIEKDGKVQVVRAGKEVILCGGVFGSPQLLMLSGIGDRKKLKEKGIALARHLPGVGQNLQEHISAVVQYSSPTTVPWGLSWKTVPWMVWQAGRYVFQRKGFFANNVLHAGGFLKTDPTLARPDLQLILMPAHRDEKGRMGIGHGFSLIAIVLRPKSIGTLDLTSADPSEAPLIDPNVLEQKDDVETLVKGLKIARKLLQSDPFSPYRGDELAPGEATQSDEQLQDYARQNSVTVFHPVGTCRMGQGDECVVDAELKVHGVDGLRVADVAICPTLIGGNTNSVAIMIAEKAADMILGKSAPPPLDVEVT